MSKARIVAAGVAASIALATPLVAKWEGLRQDPYKDIVGVSTVCYGHTANVQTRRYTVAECKALLERDLSRHESGIRKCLPPDLPVEVRAAFVSAAYNIGVKAFCGSSMARKANAGDLAGACRSLDLWVYAGGRKINGLVNRRTEERRLCEGGL